MEERSAVEESGRKAWPAAVGTKLSLLLSLPSVPVRVRVHPPRWRAGGGSTVLAAAVLSWAAEGTLCRRRADWPLTRCLVYSDLPGVPEPRGFLPPSFINLSLGSSSCDNSLEALLGLRPSSWIRVLTLPHLTCTHCSSSSVSRSTLALLSNVPVQQR